MRERAMAMLVGEDGSVENRILPLPPGLTASALTQASNYLAHLAVGRTLTETRKALQSAARRTACRTRRADAEAGRSRARNAVRLAAPHRRRR